VNRDFRDRLGCTEPTWIEYPGLRHELFNEVERRRVLDDLCRWLSDSPERL